MNQITQSVTSLAILLVSAMSLSALTDFEKEHADRIKENPEGLAIYGH